MFKLSKIASLTLLCAAVSAAHAQVKFNANIELDPKFTASRDNPKEDSKTELAGRVEVNAEATLVKQADNFVNARATFTLPVSGASVGIDDAWLMMGNSLGDLKLGRFEAADLFPLGMDVIVASSLADVGYRANKLRGRASSKLHGALGTSLMPGLRAEIGLITENSGYDATESTSDDFYGVRPTVVYSAGALTLRAGIESLKNSKAASIDSTGVGLSAGYALNTSSTLNISFAQNSKLDLSSVGANVVFNNVGLGYIQDKDVSRTSNTIYAAYKMPLLGMQNAFVTPAISHSTGTAVDAVTAVGVRFNFGF